MRWRMLKVGSVYEFVDWHMKLFKSSRWVSIWTMTTVQNPRNQGQHQQRFLPCPAWKCKEVYVRSRKHHKMHDLYMHEFFGFSYSHWNAAQRHILRGFQVVRINPDFFTPIPKQCQILSPQVLSLFREADKVSNWSGETFKKNGQK